MQEKVELLCTVRGILKKIKQSVLVGDRVRVAGIDWDDLRGNFYETSHALSCLRFVKACLARAVGAEMNGLSGLGRQLLCLIAATVDEVLPRRSELQDPAVANVDQVLLVFALERPALDLKGATR